MLGEEGKVELQGPKRKRRGRERGFWSKEEATACRSWVPLEFVASVASQGQGRWRDLVDKIRAGNSLPGH